MAGGVVGKLTTAGTGAGTHLLSNTFYGTCDTAAATAAKIVKLADTGVNAATLITGMTLSVKFTYANGVANPTLTVQTNGGTQLIAATKIMRYGTTAPSTSAASSWRAGAVVNFVYDGTNWVEVSSIDDNSTYWIQCVNIDTAAATAAKVGSCSTYNLTNNHYIYVRIRYANTVQGAITLNINSAGAKPIYINGSASSASNYTLPEGMYLVFYNGTNYYFRTDSYLTADITGTASNVRGTVAIAHGGTGATTAAAARTNLGITPANIGAAPSSHTHPVTQITWAAGENFSLTAPTANNAEYSLDLPDTTYAGSYWHIWSGKLQESIVAFYNDDASTLFGGKIGVNGAEISSTYAINCNGHIYSNGAVNCAKNLWAGLNNATGEIDCGAMSGNSQIYFYCFPDAKGIYSRNSDKTYKSIIEYLDNATPHLYGIADGLSDWQGGNTVHRFTMSTSNPSGGMNGDVWFKYS